MKTKTFFTMLFIVATIVSCSKKEEEEQNNTTQRTLGQAGNEWKADFPGGQEVSAKVISNTNGIILLKVNIGGILDTIKAKLTNNTISDFYYSDGDESKPFTLVEFNAEIGDIYTFNSEGPEKFTVQREVTDKSSYHIAALGKEVATIGVYEPIPSEMTPNLFGNEICSIIWYISPVYGLVCIEMWTCDGEYIEIEFTSINL